MKKCLCLPTNKMLVSLFMGISVEVSSLFYTHVPVALIFEVNNLFLLCLEKSFYSTDLLQGRLTFIYHFFIYH